jgi:hypothetical protein
MQLLVVLVLVTLSHANIRYSREPGKVIYLFF